MTKNINLIKSTTLIKSLSDDDILTNLKNGKFKVTSYKKSSVVHFDGEFDTDSITLLK